MDWQSKCEHSNILPCNQIFSRDRCRYVWTRFEGLITRNVNLPVNVTITVCHCANCDSVCELIELKSNIRNCIFWQFFGIDSSWFRISQMGDVNLLGGGGWWGGGWTQPLLWYKTSLAFSLCVSTKWNILWSVHFLLSIDNIRPAHSPWKVTNCI